MTTQWNLVDLNAVQPEPWRNGGGITRALLAWPTIDEWRIRCSVATVAASGPFSNFEGVDRWFSVLKGAGVSLTIDGKTHQQTVSTSPLQFAGDAKTDCSLIDGETEDFNLMLKNCSGHMHLLSQPCTVNFSKNQWIGVYSHDADITIESSSSVTTIPKQHLAWQMIQTEHTLNISSRNALCMQVTL